MRPNHPTPSRPDKTLPPRPRRPPVPDGDHWVIECHTVPSNSEDKDTDRDKDKKEEGLLLNWMREAAIRVLHKNAGLFMRARKEHMFQQPIPEQLEVVGYHGSKSM